MASMGASSHLVYVIFAGAAAVDEKRALAAVGPAARATLRAARADGCIDGF